ncbi:MAG: three-Cys-motif partner protein TcmP [Alphaproteobacteria bacterium]|nr:three-Cys-motif partner protein TcmP [Alphaproteobacteria bacterium]
MPHHFYDWSNPRKPPLLQLHSIAKHEVIKTYLEHHIERLTAHSRMARLRLTIVDGFAGGGIYRHAETDKLCAGSPFIFLETVHRMERKIRKKRTKKFCIDAAYYFIDRDNDALSFLRSQLHKKGYGDLIGERVFLLHGSFSNLFAGLMEIVRSRGGRAFFLLDQYGYKDIPLSLIKQIFTRHPSAEVLFTFAADALVNYMAHRKQYYKCVHNIDPSGRLLPREDIVKLNRLKNRSAYKTKITEWRLMTKHKLLCRLIRLCGVRYCVPYFIVSPKSNRAYWFLHFSNHLKSRNQMLKLCGRNHNVVVRHKMSGFNMFGYAPRKHSATEIDY